MEASSVIDQKQIMVGLADFRSPMLMAFPSRVVRLTFGNLIKSFFTDLKENKKNDKAITKVEVKVFMVLIFSYKYDLNSESHFLLFFVHYKPTALMKARQLHNDVVTFLGYICGEARVTDFYLL